MAVNASLNTAFSNVISTTVAPFHNNGISTDKDDGQDNEERGLVLLVVACLCCSLWLIYMTLYHSRLLGSLITKLVTMRYLKEGQFFEIGSISFSILSGKIMFRDVKYITKDLSIRVVDGYAIFKYWLPYVEEEGYRQPYSVNATETSTEIESKEPRLTIWMNCFEYHVYNRAGLYDQLQDLFRVERYGDAAKSSLNIHNVTDTIKKSPTEGEKSEQESNNGLPTWLLELVPAIKFDINTGKIAFGNKLFETTLCFMFENAVGYYTTSEAHSSLDQFMHVVKMTGKNVRIMLCPSPGYSGPKDEPPRFMGNGFVVLHTAQCKINYYQDEPGLVPEGNVGDVEAGIPDSDPHWGVDVVFLKSTSMCYGPWVDRQRDALQKFFFPMDYQEMVATKPLPPGQTRLHTGLDVKFHFDVDATLDILFSKDQETKAVHVCFGARSHIGVYQPWTVNEYGYTTSVITKLYQVEASTSMAYRKLVDADVLDLAVHMTFPRVWNQTQHWSCEISAVRVSWWFIFAHKWFFQEMLEDWTANYRPDLVTFVPYEWSFNIALRDFEMIWIANEYNYVECTSNKQEMAELAFCGELFDLTFVLQFLRFLPEFEEIKFFLQVEKLVARLCLPEHDTLHRSLLCLARTATKSQTHPVIRSRSSTSTGFPEEGIESADESAFAGSNNNTFSTIFSRHTAKNHGWVDVMSVPILGLSIGYMYHPIIPNPKYIVPRDEPLKWQPSEMEPDVITLELEAGPAALRLFGSVLKVLAAIKENYFGEDQVFQECPPFNSNMSTFTAKEVSDVMKDTINLFTLRPLEANVLISLYDFKAELTKHCGASEPSSPLLLFERLTFEMKKSYNETRLQLHLTPMTILVSDGYERGTSARHLSQGHLSLSGFQMRGHAMFSGEGLPPDGETLEYAWLTELQFGILSGKITIPQLQAIINWTQTFIFHVMSKENKLQPPVPYKRCIHGHRQDKCDVINPKTTETQEKSPQPLTKNERNSKGKASDTNKSLLGKPEDVKSKPKDICITEDDVKYRMTRVSLEDINLFVVETGIACNVQLSPIRLATCTLHCDNSTTGISMFIQNVKLRQFILAPKPLVADPVFEDIHKRMSLSDDIVWIEAAGVQLGPIISDISLAEEIKDHVVDQKSFLSLHDKKYQRLWFLWNSSSVYKSPVKNFGCCGCIGGCNFFGKNINGPRFFTSEKLEASNNDTGIAGFGSEGGLYDEGDFHDEDTKPLMYSRDALGSAYLDQSPVGSVEAFTRKRYHGSEASSPRLKRGYLMRTRHGNTDENNTNDPASRLSWHDSLQRSPSIASSKRRFMPTGSLSSSKPSLVKKPRAQPLTSCSSQGSFYSCGSLVEDDLDASVEVPIHGAYSTESFTSAVENPHELPDFVDGASPQLSDFVVSCPQLVSRYSQQLSQLECLNWSIPADIPSNKRVFNIVENLKETEPSDPLVLPGVPQFNYRNPPRFKQPLLIKKSQIRKGDQRDQENEADVSSTSTESVHVVADGNILRKSYREDDSLEESSEADSVRKATWNSALNEYSRISTTTSDTLTKRTSTTTSSSLQNLIIFRFDGEVNVFFTPLLLDALQRYTASISKQDSLLHPSLVVDLVHDMCTTTADNIYRKRLDETANMDDALPCKPNEITAFISTSKIHLAFLQVAFPEVETKTEVFTNDGERNVMKEPSTSILAGSFEGISTKLLSIQKAADNVTSSKNNLEDTENLSMQKPSEGSVVHKPFHRNTSSVMNIKCNEAQIQLHELCNKEDFEKSITTAIADNLSRTKFALNVDHLHSLTDSYNVDNIPPNSYMNLLMLECGLENITVCGGSECGGGSEVIPKIYQKHHVTKPKTKVPQEKPSSPEEPKFHGFSNPLQEDTGSVVLNMENDYSNKLDLSSLSSSISSLSSSSGGDESDMESEAGEQQQLLSSRAEKESQKRWHHTIQHVRDSFIDKDVELARRIDAKFHFSSIWFNISSPPLSKTLPSTYHLYNSLVTTIVPMSIAWIPGILELKEKIAAVQRSRHDRLTSVIACLMSQALPDHGKIPKKHGIHVLVNDTARYLQEDHSSQLLYTLRKQLMGSRLEKVQSALIQKNSIPDNKKLVKGIFALARQWKCFLAGTEKGEILFYGTNSIKRHVVGRGVLTERDRAILMKEDDQQVQENTDQEVTSDGGQEQGIPTGDPSSINSDDNQQEDETSKLLDSNGQSMPLEEIHHTQRSPLIGTSTAAPDTDTETDESPPTTMRKAPQNKHLLGVDNKKYGHRKQLSLYSWLSNTPATSPNTAARPVATDGARPTKLTIQSPLVSPIKSEQNNKIFGSEMVSVPTSGKKIQDEKETFKTLLQAISLKPKVAEEKDTAKTISLTTTLKYIRVDLVDGEINNLSSSSKKRKTSKQLFKDDEPIFLAKDFNFRLLFSKSPMNANILGGDLQSLSNSMINRVKFSVGVGNITQKVNFPFVRLVIQLVDMVDVLAGLIKSKAEEIQADKVDGPAPHFTNVFGPSKVRSTSPSSVKCWKTMYQVLDLYSSLPREPKGKSGFKKAGTPGSGRAIDSPLRLKEVKIDMEDGPQTFSPARRQDDHRPLIDTYSIVGVVTLPSARLLASIGDLRQEIDIKDVSFVLTKTEEKGADETDRHSGSISFHVGNVNCVLLEKVKQNHGMVVSVLMSRSHAVYSYQSHASAEKNVAFVSVGVIDVEIPQHPVALHTMMTRSSRTISRQITDIQSQRSIVRCMGVTDTTSPPSYTKRLSGVPAEFVKQHLVGSPTGAKVFADSVDGLKPDIIPIKCDIVLKGFCLSASLLPSLRAGYKIGRISATTNTGSCSKFKATMPSHSLMFSSKVQTFESNVPSSAMVDLPPVKVSGEFLAGKITRPRSGHRGQRAHLYVNAEIGAFQHCLTTDLLNHLVFVQKSFMKEVNDVVQRVSGENQPVPLWRTVSSESVDSSKHKEAPFSYSFGLTLKGIQITATTPAATAVRLDTGVISLEVSNAVPSPIEHGKLKRSGSFVKLFGKAQVDINLSLGQFIKSRIIDNELDYMQMAYFKTTIGVRNSFQDVSSTRGTEDKETFLITLTQPKVYAQQMAFDKAVLVYLNYKNAYDHWNQQKMSLHAEVHTATQALLEKLPARTHAAQLSVSLFLQVTVDRLGICIPLFSANQPNVPGIYSKQNDVDQGSALILSVDEMMLSCCSSASFVSRGKFNRFCLWFADKFDMEASEWRPDSNLRLMNTCVVSEGTYELCSKTNRYPIVPDMAKTGKWVMSIRWQMCGVEVLTDTNIGKWLSLLGNTLTAFAGETDIANLDSVADMTEKEPSKDLTENIDEVDHKPPSVRKSRKKSLEKEMWEQARKVNELRRRSDVSQSALEKETRLLQELENAVFNEFRKGVRKKIRKHSRSRQTYPYHINTQKSTPPQRKTMSERPKSSKTRSRLRKQVAEDDSDYDDDLPLKTKPRNHLNVSDIPVLTTPDFTGMESTSTLTWSREDVLDEGGSGTPFCSTPDDKQSWMQHSHQKVKFSPSATELNDSGSFSPKSSMLTQQNLDFELDVIVNIDSGKCVLHLANENDETNEMRTPSNRTFSSAELPKSKPFSPSYSAGARRYKTNSQDVNSQDTVILLPGVDVRVNYSSNFESELGSPSSYGQDGNVFLVKPPDQPSFDAQSQTSPSNVKVFKSAGVYISVLFQSLPQEMVLKPSLIDFLERALEPIILPSAEETIDAGGSVSDNGSDPECETGGSIVSSSMSESSSFPVDVVVVFRVKPSDIRLSCQPVSKVECMLRLPALDVVFSSKSSCNKTPVLMTSGDQPKLEDRSVQAFESGGISFTFCLSSFSFCIFHPYGKEHTVVTRSTSAPLDNGDSREENRQRFRFNPPQPMSGKKDSLSLDVEFIKFNLSRRRVCDSQESVPNSPGPTSSTVVKVSGICDIGSAAFTYDMRRLNEILDFPKAWYKRRLVSRLFLGKEGSYATKSAKESPHVPFQSPQAARSPAVEEKRRSSPPTNAELQTPLSPSGRPMLHRSMSEDERHMQYTLATPLKTPAKQKLAHKKTTSTAGLFSFLPSSPSLFRSMTMTGNRQGLLSPTTPHKMKRRTLSEYVEYGDIKKNEKSQQDPVVNSSVDNTDTEVDGPLSQSSSSSSGSKSKWETAIVVAVNLSRLDVNTNMGSVMGQTLWSTSDLRAQGHLTLTSTGRRHLQTKLKVRQAVCESRSGIVGGHAEINDFIAKANGTEERGCKPEHMVQIKLCHAETRIDYMGTCILMGNISALQFDLKDQWILQQGDSPSTDSLFKIEKESPVQKEPPQCKIYVKADMSWTDFKLMISRSTTPDLIKMIAKIQEFFTQQHRNSLRALSTLRNPTPLNAGTILSNLATPQSTTTPKVKDKDMENDGLKYQHWSKVLNAVTGLKLSMLSDPIPDRGVILGGSLALRGKTVSLACFHGVNFRAQSWVLFNLKQLYTEFISRVRAEEKSCYVRRVRAVQTLLMKLGYGEEDEDLPGNLSPSMSYCVVVRKVSRGRRNPPSMGSTVQEWLTYVCATGEDDICPSEDPPKRGESFNSSNKKQSQGNRSRANSYRYEHDSEPVFGLPKFEVELETKHDMPMSYFASTWSRKKHSITSRALTRPSPHVVQCSLTSSFEDSLCVTMDVGLLFFLHDVVKSYIKENETSSGSIPRGAPSPARSDTPEKDEREVAPKVDQQKRIRQFRSEGWKLEPRVRFMSWAGKNIEPVNIDWVLQKLGFTHARLTIPKWAQRGAMDPMDVFISMLIDKMMATMQEDSNN